MTRKKGLRRFGNSTLIKIKNFIDNLNQDVAHCNILNKLILSTDFPVEDELEILDEDEIDEDELDALMMEELEIDDEKSQKNKKKLNWADLAEDDSSVDFDMFENL